VEWPAEFYEMREGRGCPLCAQGRPDEAPSAIRFFAGQVSDGYLVRAAPQRGFTWVVWRGRHVAEPTELSNDEAALYWREVLKVARAIEEYLKPVKLNFNILGNAVPHLHTHVIPRYAIDPKPGWPFPFPEDDPPPRNEAELRADVEALREILGRVS
jgi:diadenosine tetraphosphate (Ap4A) HIT family hydrolase